MKKILLMFAGMMILCALVSAQTADTLYINGTVTDSAAGAGIEGALVIASARTGGGGGGGSTPVDTITTDASGDYSFNPLIAAGRISIRVSVDGYYEKNEDLGFSPDDTSTIDFALIVDTTSVELPVLIAVSSPTTEVRPVLAWHPVTGAATYTVQVDTFGNFRNPFIDSPTSDTIYTPLVDMPVGKTVYWRVSSDLDVAQFSDRSEFEITDPYVPVLTAYTPETTTVTQPTLSWGAVSGATEYIIQISSARNFDSPVIVDTVAATSYDVATDLPAGDIYWRVQSDLSSTWSDVDEFHLLDTTIPVLIPYSPESTTVTRPTLNWNSVSGATVYTIQIDTVGDFSAPAVSVPTADTSYAVLVDLPAGDIYWRVTSDASSGYSAVDEFHILDTTIPVLIPYEPDITTETRPTLTWYAVDGASEYTIQINDRDNFFRPEVETTVAGTSFTPAADLAEGNVYWRVISDVSSAYSAADNFSIVSDEVPMLVTFDGAALTTLRPTFVWHPVDSATAYQIQISYTRDFASPAISTPTADTSYTPLIDLQEGTVYWRVSCDLDLAAYSPEDEVVLQISGIAGSPVHVPGMIGAVYDHAAQMVRIAVPAGADRLMVHRLDGSAVSLSLDASGAAWSTAGAAPGLYMVTVNIDGRTYAEKVMIHK